MRTSTTRRRRAGARRPRRSGSSASPTAATTSKPASVSRRTRPSLSSTESSAITTRMAAPLVHAWARRAGSRQEAAVDAGHAVGEAAAVRCPAASASPRPSSQISMMMRSCSSRTVTRADVAWLWRATFVSDSAMTKYAVVSPTSGGRLLSCTSTTTGTGQRAASAETAASSPRSARMAGEMPRTSWRSSASVDFASSCARSTSARPACGSDSSFSRAMPRSIASAVSCCCDAVVEVALDPPPLLRGGVEHARAAGAQHIDARLQLLLARAEQRSRDNGVPGRHQADEVQHEQEQRQRDQRDGNNLRERLDCRSVPFRVERARHAVRQPAVVDRQEQKAGGRPEPGDRDHELDDADRKEQQQVDEVAPDRAIGDERAQPRPPRSIRQLLVRASGCRRRVACARASVRPARRTSRAPW